MFDREKLCQSLKELKLSKYKKKTTLEEAPHTTDCLTAVAYIIQQAAHAKLPVYYIGDMPRMLLKIHRWKLLYVTPRSLRDGDLIFAKNRQCEKLVGHVALAASGLLCHSTRQGFKKEEPRTFFETYEQPYEGSLLKTNVDSRNVAYKMMGEGNFKKSIRNLRQ